MVNIPNIITFFYFLFQLFIYNNESEDYFSISRNIICYIENLIIENLINYSELNSKDILIKITKIPNEIDEKNLDKK